MRCVVVIPTYNEAPTIGPLLDSLEAVRKALPRPHVEVLVVDDDSPDGTAGIVREHPGFGRWIQLLSRTSREGLGAAYRAGFAAALAADHDIVIQLDADGSHPVAQIPAMLALLGRCDVVIGSRYVIGGRTEDWPPGRQVLSRAANLYARRVLGLRTHDVTSGFRAWRSTALDAAGVLQSTSLGHAFQVETTWRAERRGLRVLEHPITFTDRAAGHSKMSAVVAGEAARLVLHWRIDELRGRFRAPWSGSGRSLPAARRHA